MTHTITVMIDRFGRPEADFHCCEPDTAWCRQNLSDREDPDFDESMREHPDWCWFTVLASGLVPWGPNGMYDGPPHQELRSGEVEFIRVDDAGHDYACWHYKGDAGGYEFDVPGYIEEGAR